MSSNHKRSSLGWALGISLGIACSTGVVHAGSIGDTYTTGDTLTAGKMDNIKNAVNDNDTRLGAVINNTQAGTLKTEVDKITGIINNTQAGALKTAVDSNSAAIADLQGGVPAATCAGNPAIAGDTMVRVGSVCVDKYEASIQGTCANATGEPCTGSAKSVTGVLPAVSVSWYQAARLCANAGKRLITSAEWQMAAIGTPGSPTCNGTGTLANTGANASCVSSFAVNDMAGNAAEWVADWATSSANNVVDISAALVGVARGGDAGDAGAIGVNYHGTNFAPSSTDALRGFRCAR